MYHQELIAELVREYSKKEEVLGIILFGSHALGIARSDSDEDKYNTNPFSPDAREDGEPFILYVQAFNPGEGGATEEELDISIGYGGSITYGFSNVAEPVPVLFRVTDMGHKSSFCCKGCW